MSGMHELRMFAGQTIGGMITLFTSTYGEQEDQQALSDFVMRTLYHEVSEEALVFFSENYPDKFELDARTIIRGCFHEIKTNEGFYVVNHPQHRCEYIFLYKRFLDSLVIHPFQVFEDSWKLLTPTKVSVSNNHVHIESLTNYTSCPDGRGRDYVLPQTEHLLGVRNTNLALFCFISIYCAD